MKNGGNSWTIWYATWMPMKVLLAAISSSRISLTLFIYAKFHGCFFGAKWKYTVNWRESERAEWTLHDLSYVELELCVCVSSSGTLIVRIQMHSPVVLLCLLCFMHYSIGHRVVIYMLLMTLILRKRDDMAALCMHRMDCPIQFALY